MTTEKTIEDYETCMNNEIVCPYCGEEQGDSWEVCSNINEGDLGLISCEHCEKNFTANRNMSITYDSYPAPCCNGSKEHDFRQTIGHPNKYFVGKFRCKICGEEKKKETKKCPTCKGGTFSPTPEFNPNDCPECDGAGIIIKEQ